MKQIFPSWNRWFSRSKETHVGRRSLMPIYSRPSKGSNLAHVHLSSPLSIRALIIPRKAVLSTSKMILSTHYIIQQAYIIHRLMKNLWVCATLEQKLMMKSPRFVENSRLGWFITLRLSAAHPTPPEQRNPLFSRVMPPFKLEQIHVQFVIKGPTTVSQHSRYRPLQNRHGCSIPLPLQLAWAFSWQLSSVLPFYSETWFLMTAFRFLPFSISL